MTAPRGRPDDAPDRRGEVVVVGGGLAGLTAACVLADAGRPVTVLEARRNLGGAARSFVRDTGAGAVDVDTGQHVVLACYHRYRALLDRLGSADELRFQPDLRIPVLPEGGRGAELAAARLPSPLHAAAALARYRLLGPGDRLRALRTAVALARLDPRDPAVDAVPLGDWLRRRGEGARARAVLWRLLCEAALNADLDDASLAAAVTVVRTGFAGAGRADARIGLPARSLGDLHVEPARGYLARRSARIRTRCAVRALHREPRPDRPWSVLTDEGATAAAAVVLAVPAAQAAHLLPTGAGPAPEDLRGLGSAPIVTAHLRLDRPVLARGFTAVVHPDLSWVFDRTAQLHRPEGQYLVMPISAADRWVDLPAAAVRERLLTALHTVLPASARARVLDFWVTRERHATFRQAPGTARLRPPAATALPGLVLAGAWTDTGWPDTLEGAVRSGETAARVLLRAPGPAAAPVPAGAQGAWSP